MSPQRGLTSDNRIDDPRPYVAGGSIGTGDLTSLNRVGTIDRVTAAAARNLNSGKNTQTVGTSLPIKICPGPHPDAHGRAGVIKRAGKSPIYLCKTENART